MSGQHFRKTELRRVPNETLKSLQGGFIKPIFLFVILGLGAAYWSLSNLYNNEGSLSHAYSRGEQETVLDSLKSEMRKIVGEPDDLDWSIIYRGNQEERAVVSAAIQEASKLYDISPDLIRAVIMTESLFNNNAKSKKGAEGLMQIMPGTAKHLGITDPYNPRDNILGGAAYMSELLKKFDGDIKLSIAAYNLGPGAVMKSNGSIPTEIIPYVSKVVSYYELFSGKQVG